MSTLIGKRVRDSLEREWTVTDFFGAGQLVTLEREGQEQQDRTLAEMLAHENMEEACGRIQFHERITCPLDDSFIEDDHIHEWLGVRI